MNNFIFENATKVFFGQGCVKEYLRCLVKPYGTVMLAYGGGSIRKNGPPVRRPAGYRVNADYLPRVSFTVFTMFSADSP